MNGHILASGKTLYARLLEYVPGGSPGSCNGYPPYITEVVGIRCGCFDGNAADGDGCSAACQVEPCFTCSGLPSVCVPSLPVAACDDGSVCTTGETCSVGGACGGGSPVVPCVDLTGDWTVHGDAGPYGTADSSAAITQRDMDVVFRDSTSGAPGYVGTVFPTHGRFRARGGN